MDSDEILQKIIQIFRDTQISEVPGYNKFGYIRETISAVIVSRQNGEDTRIPFSKIKQGIEAVKVDKKVYDDGPASLRKYGITHINSPIWSLLRLVPKSDY
ncbi:hypothetical protein [Natronogracilivirga saccharolytica]|uniref:Uncharacterized protein n=1 Tax=Natronogracilivirga saccharolytica TaxID=2812953 RepID=A0A8J7S6X1_9BACT|nr:hypothetical protein [Natronogracilivirga saccharolytica]MBP3193063.1 hypothetical protein [Natronogracilivirga saccharolytica]